MYEYLGQLDEVKSRYEAQRLLYVAVTRAKARLYLMDHSERSSKNSFRNLLNHLEFIEEEPGSIVEEVHNLLPGLGRLPLGYYQNIPSEVIDLRPHLKTTSLITSVPRLIGIVTHKLLQWICDNHPQTVTEIPWGLARYELRKLGFNETMQHEALSGIQEQITRMFEDPTGIWIIKKHSAEQNEYELLVEHQSKPITRIIDRTFEEHGKRWIIDFKTGREDESSLIQHRQQLNEYGSYLARHTSLPIYCGIYYLPSNHWVNWHYELPEMLV